MCLLGHVLKFQVVDARLKKDNRREKMENRKKNWKKMSSAAKRAEMVGVYFLSEFVAPVTKLQTWFFFLFALEILHLLAKKTCSV